EDRTVPAGNVTAMAFEDILYIVGDNASNQIAITGTGSDSVRIRALDATTRINGQTSVDITHTHGGLYILMNDGDDTLSISGVTARRCFHIDMGAGNDALTIVNVFSLRTSQLLGGAGNDTYMILVSQFYRH